MAQWWRRLLPPRKICDTCRHLQRMQALADGGVGRFHTVEVCRNPASRYHNLGIPLERRCPVWEPQPAAER